MNDEFTPLLPPSAPVSQGAVPTAAPAVNPVAAPSPAIGPAHRAGESITPAPATTSSRPGRDRWLAGVVAASLLSATVASAATVGAIAGTGALTHSASTSPAAAATSRSASATSAGSVTLKADDAVVAVAQKASPAVVTLTVQSAGDGSGFGPLSMPSTGVGSGFLFDSNGLILTNHHVIEGSGSITVTFQDTTEMTGTVVADDPTRDLAVVKVDATGLPTIPVGSSKKLEVGQLVVAIGSPLGQFTETVTSGILSATGRTIQVGSQFSRQSQTMTGLLQTDAAINEGNSGGPLLDANGDVVGVNVAVAASAQGIGFAIPIDDAASIMAKARAATGAT